MAHKIAGRNMFFLYMYIIHVLFALLLKHGGNGSIVIAADLLHFNPYWVVPSVPLSCHLWGLVAGTCLSGHWSATYYRATNRYSFAWYHSEIQGHDLFCIGSYVSHLHQC